MSDDRALECVRNGLLIHPLELAGIAVRGPDARSWLNGMATADFAKASEDGGALFGLFCAKNGKLLSELYALLEPKDILVGVHPGRASQLLELLDRHLIMEDAEVALAEPQPSWALALGPHAEQAARLAREAGGRAGLVRRAGVEVAVIAAKAEIATPLLAALTRLESAMQTSASSWERVRIELGIPLDGVDFDDSNYPQEAALELDGVSFNKGCYLGQEAVFMLEKRGHVKKRLVQLAVAAPVAAGDVVRAADGSEVGQVTSYAPREQGGIALGFVKYKHARAGVELQVGSTTARVEPKLAIVPE